jgi:hypothetical protein
MFNTKFTSDLKDANPPVDFSFFADGEAIGVCVDDVNPFEGRVKCDFAIGLACYDGYPREMGELDCCGV